MLESTKSDNRAFGDICLAALILGSIVVAAAFIISKSSTPHVATAFDLSGFIGSTIQSLLSGHALQFCSTALGTDDPVCFHSARMPVPTLVVAAAVKLLGASYYPVLIFKSLVSLAPLWGAMAIVQRQPGQTRAYLIAAALLLFVPLLMPNYANDILNLTAEEGYLYGLVALGVALLLFPGGSSILAWGVLAALTLAAIYLTKSSMLPAVFVLLLGIVARAPNWRIRGLIICLFALAPISWVAFQHAESGRFTLGTSIDGLNFHKGNNPGFLDRYPPPSGTLDQYDVELSRGHVFKDEWAFNDFHMKAGLAFVIEHPLDALKGVAEKIDVMFFTLDHTGGGNYGPLLELLILSNMVVFRLLLWTAIAISLYAVITGKSIGRFLGASFFLFVVAYATPYVLGFAFTRHAVVLVYPAVLLICRALLSQDRLAQDRLARAGASAAPGGTALRQTAAQRGEIAAGSR